MSQVVIDWFSEFLYGDVGVAVLENMFNFSGPPPSANLVAIANARYATAVARHSIGVDVDLPDLEITTRSMGFIQELTGFESEEAAAAAEAAEAAAQRAVAMRASGSRP